MSPKRSWITTYAARENKKRSGITSTQAFGYGWSTHKRRINIDMNLVSPISTKGIAQNQYLTPNYLSARFKEEVGVCISDYLLKRRVGLACRLLTSSQLSVQEVAGK